MANLKASGFPLLGLFLAAAPAAQAEQNLTLGAELWGFAERGLQGQDRDIVSASIEPEYTEDAGLDDRFAFHGLARIDSDDPQRTHADIRTLYWHHLGPDWDLRVGVDRVFWGVTEFDNPADIVNQTDLVEDLDGDEKLGQPMVRWTYLGNMGTLDVLALPWFRERTFPGEDGRFRPEFPINDNDAKFESGAGKHRLDAAIRYRLTWMQTDWALSHFSGTSRDPLFIPTLTDNGPALIPFYPVIDQTSLTLQSARGRWLWKLEAISQSGAGDRHTAATGGFEVTQYGIADTGWDIGWIAEYLFDDRGDAATTPFERDWFFGARLQFNDIQSSEALWGVAWDPATGERIYSLEASRRLGPHHALDIEARVFSGTEAGSKLNYLRNDDYLRVQIHYYF